MNPNSDYNASQTLQHYHRKSGQEIERLGQQQALELFQRAAKSVPAYRDFLAKNKIEPTKIKTLDDFDHVPIMTKQNYLTQYEMRDLCWNGDLAQLSVISSSSGSTGQPYFWPRGLDQEKQGALLHEMLLGEFFDIDTTKTLFINCFAMGSWVAGTYVHSSIEQLSWRGYPIISITPGIEIDLIIQQFQSLAPQFEQIIISGYPPFVKDVLDAGSRHGIEWSKYRVKFLFAAEGFSEEWRRYIHQVVGAKLDDIVSINCYGSADAGLLAHETDLSIAIRQQVVHRDLIEKFFGEQRLPTMAQYDPQLRYFEEVEQKLIFSAPAGIPLIRYDIGDNGRVMTYADTINKLASLDIKVPLLSEKHWKLPFVWVFGRQDLTVSLYGVLIYPEYVKYAIEPLLSEGYITGKFSMRILNDQNNDQLLHIAMELSEGQNERQEAVSQLQKTILDALKIKSSEVKRLHQSIGDRVKIQVELLPYKSGLFKAGAKQKWVVKT